MLKIQYYVNGGQARTWREVLHWAYVKITQRQKSYNYKTKRYEEHELYSINDGNAKAGFHSGYRHHENDGYWEGGYSRSVLDYQEKIELVGPLQEHWKVRPYHYKSYYKEVWVPKVFKPKSYQVTDNMGRVIPSSIIVSDLRNYKYDPNDEVKHVREKDKYYRKWGWQYELKEKQYKYRQGPVPDISGHYRRGRGWQKYRGDHCGITPWKRDYYAAQVEEREVREEYGVTFKVPDKIPYPYHRTRQHGWKRTRVEKQWMRGLRD